MSFSGGQTYGRVNLPFDAVVELYGVVTRSYLQGYRISQPATGATGTVYRSTAVQLYGPAGTTVSFTGSIAADVPATDGQKYTGLLTLTTTTESLPVGTSFTWSDSTDAYYFTVASAVTGSSLQYNVLAYSPFPSVLAAQAYSYVYAYKFTGGSYGDVSSATFCSNTATVQVTS